MNSILCRLRGRRLQNAAVFDLACYFLVSVCMSISQLYAGGLSLSEGDDMYHEKSHALLQARRRLQGKRALAICSSQRSEAPAPAT